jgi:hypothetical protein
MELVFAVMFFAVGLFMFVLGLYQEYEYKEDEDQEDKSNFLCIIFWGVSTASF